MNQRTDDKLPRLLAGLRELEKAVPEYDTLIRAAIEELEAPPAATGATPRVDKVAHGCMECGDRVDADFARRLQEGCDNYENERRLRLEAERDLAEAYRLAVEPALQIAELERRSALAASSTGAPVAWMEVDHGDRILGCSTERDETSPFTWKPLYAAPQSAVGAPSGKWCIKSQKFDCQNYVACNTADVCLRSAPTDDAGRKG